MGKRKTTQGTQDAVDATLVHSDDDRVTRAVRKRRRTQHITGASDKQKNKAINLATGAKQYSWMNPKNHTPAATLGGQTGHGLGITSGPIAKELGIGEHQKRVAHSNMNSSNARGAGINMTAEQCKELGPDPAEPASQQATSPPTISPPAEDDELEDELEKEFEKEYQAMIQEEAQQKNGSADGSAMVSPLVEDKGEDISEDILEKEMEEAWEAQLREKTQNLDVDMEDSVSSCPSEEDEDNFEDGLEKEFEKAVQAQLREEAQNKATQNKDHDMEDSVSSCPSEEDEDNFESVDIDLKDPLQGDVSDDDSVFNYGSDSDSGPPPVETVRGLKELLRTEMEAIYQDELMRASQQKDTQQKDTQKKDTQKKETQKKNTQKKDISTCNTGLNSPQSMGSMENPFVLSSRETSPEVIELPPKKQAPKNAPKQAKSGPKKVTKKPIAVEPEDTDDGADEKDLGECLDLAWAVLKSVFTVEEEKPQEIVKTQKKVKTRKVWRH